MALTGKVLRDDRFASEYADFAEFTTPAIRWHPTPTKSEDRLVTFTAKDVVVTSYFIPIDAATGRMFLNHSYADIENSFPTRFKIEKKSNTFTLATEIVRHKGRYVNFGGPIDRVWYHWVVNWCLRFIVLQRLRPELFTDPDVRFIMHPLALEQPYRAVLDVFGIPESRLYPVDPLVDHAFEEVTLVTFCNQVRLYPELIPILAVQLREGLGLRPASGERNVFASRQGLGAPRRRIHNFAEVEPVLRRHRFDILELGELSAKEQAQAFHDADIVVGAHGSDLTNILFCRPRTRFIVFENAISIARADYLNLKFFAELLDIDYEVMKTPTTYMTDVEPMSLCDPVELAKLKDADYIVDFEDLEARLKRPMPPGFAKNRGISGWLARCRAAGAKLMARGGPR